MLIDSKYNDETKNGQTTSNFGRSPRESKIGPRRKTQNNGTRKRTGERDRTGTGTRTGTFSTNDTGVVLNWNETTYGTKAYTIEINGASHSSHNIQLNEAVVFSDIEVLVSPQGNGDTATNITTNLSSGYTPNPPHDSAIKQRLSNNNTNTHDLANAVAWRNSDNNTDTKIIYEFPFITNVSKWEIWDARRD